MAETIDDTKEFTIALTTPSAAEGKIVNLEYPASVLRGASFDVDASTENVGNTAGNFRMQIYIDDVLKYTSPLFNLAAGVTSPDKIVAITAPASGTSMIIKVTCRRFH